MTSTVDCANLLYKVPGICSNHCKIRVYHNSSKGKVFLSFEESNKGVVIKVNDPIGKLVKMKSANSNDLVLLDLSDCPSGLYYIRVEIGRQRFVQKIIMSP